MSWSTSAAFKAAITRSHTPTMKLEILEGGLVVASTEIVEMTQELNVISGQVNDDRKATAGRRSADWVIADRKNILTPLHTQGIIYPMKDRDVRLWRGVGTELVPMATVQLQSLDVSEEAAATTFSMGGVDRAAALAAMDWRVEFEIVEGMTPRAATLAILAQVHPGYTYTLRDAPTTKTLDAMLFLPGETPTPWEAILKIWESAAQEVFFDQMGHLTTTPIPDPSTQPIAWAFEDGEASVRVPPLQVTVDRASLRNGVIVKGSAPWLLYGITAEAWDTDSLSPTYYDPSNPTASLVGPHPEYIEDALIGDEVEAQALATAKLPSILGIEEQVAFSAIPNPALEAGDAVTIQSKALGSASRYVLDQLTTPLTWQGVQTANTRRRNR